MNLSRFKIGDYVKVINQRLESYNHIGKVECADWNGLVAVSFDNWNGLGEKTLSFSEFNLDKVNDNMKNYGGNTMAVNGDYMVATVKFAQGTNTIKEYSFALFDADVFPSDFVLCDTANRYSVARVTGIVHKNEWEGVPVTKEIICKLDFSAFEKRKELRKQKEALKKQMDKIVADNQELILYQAIAEKNPEMAAMLAEYKSLANI